MKRLLLLLTCAIVLSTAAPLAAFRAQKPQGAGSERKYKKVKVHKEKHDREKHDPLHKSPKSVGWWHHGPGPAGAGAK
jgi:hypothetical protein